MEIDSADYDTIFVRSQPKGVNEIEGSSSTIPGLLDEPAVWFLETTREEEALRKQGNVRGARRREDAR